MPCWLAWRLARRDWRQQLLVFLLLTVAVGAAVAGSAMALASNHGPAGQFGSGEARIQLDGTDAARVQAVIAAARSRFGVIDVVGHVFFLFPICIVMIVTGVPFFQRSFHINEQSGNAGGLPQWPAKSLIMIAFAFLLVQGISELIKRIAVMRGLIPDPHESQVSALEAEVEHLVEAIEKK